jgi:hypothetical protein
MAMTTLQRRIELLERRVGRVTSEIQEASSDIHHAVITRLSEAELDHLEALLRLGEPKTHYPEWTPEQRAVWQTYQAALEQECQRRGWRFTTLFGGRSANRSRTGRK